MFSVDFNKAENVLRIKIGNDFDERQARLWLEQIRVSLADVQPGFQILTDLSEAENTTARITS